jgi:hypothetical protein
MASRQIISKCGKWQTRIVKWSVRAKVPPNQSPVTIIYPLVCVGSCICRYTGREKRGPWMRSLRESKDREVKLES